MKNPDHKSNPFESAIKRYLDERAASDPQFAKVYANPGKSVSECCNFIICEVRKKNRTAFTNDEIYGLAVHYYDEADLGEIKSAPKCRVVMSVESSVTPAPEEPAVAKPVAKSAAKQRKTPQPQDLMPSLFDNL